VTYPPAPSLKGGVLASVNGVGPRTPASQTELENHESLITGQRIDLAKLELARQFRRKLTPAEQALWNRLRANRLNGWHFRCQQIIDGFLADFYCHAAALVVEVDGPIHLDPEQSAYDRAREEVFAARGLRVLRVTNDEIHEAMAGVLDRIRTACEQRKRS
jgi:very-short-patch-repair endonuclease